MTYKQMPLQKIRSVDVGDRTHICDFVDLNDCRIGSDTKIGPFTQIQGNATIGDRCKISSHTFICEGVRIEDEVFVGHNVVFVNDQFPSESGNATSPSTHQIRVKKGASIGSGAIIVSPAVIGEKALVGAGAVVIADVPDGAVVIGNPSRLLASGA
jgi:acetyltransferase-like isoleucine patch superfamily enzyme